MISGLETWTVRPLVARLLLGALTLMVGAATTSGQTPKAPTLRFESEIVRLEVAPDSLTVRGLYLLSCAPGQAGFTTLYYPYPDDQRLGGARSLELSVRVLPDTTWQAAEFRELPHNLGAHWRLPLAPGKTIEVQTVYRQALHTGFARYIVTTMSGWEHPLKHARFEITLPDDCEPLEFSFPFEPCERDGKVFWCFEAVDFRPEKDIDVWWRSTTANKELEPKR